MPEDFKPTFTAGSVALGRIMSDINHYGACHTVVDDGNLEDHHIQGCIDDLECTPEERTFLRMLLLLTEDERETAWAIDNGMEVPELWWHSTWREMNI